MRYSFCFGHYKVHVNYLFISCPVNDLYYHLIENYLLAIFLSLNFEWQFDNWRVCFDFFQSSSSAHFSLADLWVSSAENWTLNNLLVAKWRPHLMITLRNKTIVTWIYMDLFTMLINKLHNFLMYFSKELNSTFNEGWIMWLQFSWDTPQLVLLSRYFITHNKEVRIESKLFLFKHINIWSCLLLYLPW